MAIGGNALSPAGEPATIENQFRHSRESLASIVDFARRGWRIAIVHGNGPQVGDELLRNETARAQVPELPLGVLVASTAGWIGYMVQQSLENALARVGAERHVVTIVTQVRVDPEHPSAREPRKFIGRKVDPEAAGSLRARGVRVEEDDEGRLRRRVPSPEPLEIVEGPVIRGLVEDGIIVVAAGGGGIPAYVDPGLGLEGLDAVVDKDLAASLLGREVGADVLLVLTDVDGVYEAYGTPRARRLPRLSLEEARELMRSGELGEGSMEPKVRAAVEFVAGGGKRAVIAALQEASRAIAGRAGTEIRASGSGADPGVGGTARTDGPRRRGT